MVSSWVMCCTKHFQAASEMIGMMVLASSILLVRKALKSLRDQYQSRFTSNDTSVVSDSSHTGTPHPVPAFARFLSQSSTSHCGNPGQTGSCPSHALSRRSGVSPAHAADPNSTTSSSLGNFHSSSGTAANKGEDRTSSSTRPRHCETTGPGSSGTEVCQSCTDWRLERLAQDGGIGVRSSRIRRYRSWVHLAMVSRSPGVVQQFELRPA
mmetsp:Transcript_42469/g.111908  ORF Transcript_42469/g.111908 Transcript_42469/m.111908 type:complete len:210 (-) Transcript_42469:7-636(-)